MGTRLTGLGVAYNETATAKTLYATPAWLAPDYAGTAAAEIVVYVGDRTGRVIGELNGDIEGVAWKLSDYGQARISLAWDSAAATEWMLRPGNRVLIQFSNGLPDWGGMLDLPMKWQDGRVGVVAYSGERLLMDRITDRGRYFNSVTAGQIFRALVSEMEPNGISVGDIWDGGEFHSPDYHLRDLHDIFTKSLTDRIEQADWDVTARLLNGRILFEANYYEEKGIDHGDKLAFLEGVNLSGATLEKQGPIVNEWQLAGAGSGWSDTTRIFAAAKDTTSIARYGLRQRGETRVDVSRYETLDNSATVLLEESREPRPVLSITAIDRPPARFYQYDIGDYVHTELYSAGFGGYEASVRIRAREFLPGSGVCSLVIE